MIHASRGAKLVILSLVFMLTIGLALGMVLVLDSAQIAQAAGAQRSLSVLRNYPGCGTSIQDCIDNVALPGDTILIAAGEYTESLTLNKAVSLTGQLSSTTIIHAVTNQRVLTVTGATITNSTVISGLMFANGNVTGSFCPSACGGGILVTGTAQPLFQNAILYNNVASYGGGGMYVDLGGAPYPLITMTLINTQFISNSTAAYGSGGGLGGFVTVMLNGGSFENNRARYGGGLSVAKLILTDTQFISNTSSDNGGGLNASQAMLNGGLFQNNRSWDGGGMGAGESILTGTQFINNTADQTGGGLYASGPSILNDALFLNNSSKTAAGGMWAFDAATLNGGLFLNNSSTNNLSGYGYGGGLYAAYTLTVTGTQFINNVASTRAGGLNASGPLNLNGGLFQNNGSPYGGGLFAFNSLMLTGTQFIGNSASVSGGGVLQTVGSGRIVNALFARNTAIRGTALYLGSSGNVQVLHTTIASPGVANGSAVYIADGTVGLTNTIVASHTIGINRAGGMVAENYNLFFGNSTNAVGITSTGANDVFGDPRFVNPTSDNYHLSAGSAAINAGANAGVVTDIDGEPRDALPDIGADEYPGKWIYLPLVVR